MRSSLTILGAMMAVALVLVLARSGFAVAILYIGLLAVGLWITSALRSRSRPSPSQPENLTAGQFRKAVNLGAFLDKTLRDRVAEAIRVWQDCESMVENADRSGLGGYFADRMTTVRESVLTVYELASHLNSYGRNRVSPEELTRLAGEVQVLKDSLDSAPTPEMREQIERNLESKVTLLASRRSLAVTMTRASWQLDGTLALLKALSAQMRMALVMGDGYVEGVQQVVDDLRREVRDLQHIGQMIGGLNTSASTVDGEPPTRSEVSTVAEQVDQKTLADGPPGTGTTRPSLTDGRLGRLMWTLGSVAARRPPARNERNKP